MSTPICQVCNHGHLQTQSVTRLGNGGGCLAWFFGLMGGFLLALGFFFFIVGLNTATSEGTGLGISFSLIVGLPGGLLVAVGSIFGARKKVLQCTNCGATFDAS